MLPPRIVIRPGKDPELSVPSSRRLRCTRAHMPFVPVSIEFVDSRASLREHARDIEALAETAIEANIFYEPWMLFPALDSFAPPRRLSFLLAYSKGQIEGIQRPVLCGFFPLERRSSYRGAPIPTLTLWRYSHNFLATPLLKNGYASDVLKAFFTWLESEGRGIDLLEMPHVSASGSFHSALQCALLQNPEFKWSESRFERALFRPCKNADHYLGRALSKKKRKEYGRLQRRLSELGKLTWDELNQPGEVSRWIDEFLRLEASGWKGRSGTALASNVRDRSFFSAIAEGAYSRSRLKMLALRLDGRAIAIKCNLMAGDGGFAFKIAYDEDFEKYSPGVLLELEHIRRLHDQPGLRWMDSCAAPDHFMANRLWTERKPMRTVLVSTGGGVGNFAVGVLDLIKRLSSSRAPDPIHAHARQDIGTPRPGISSILNSRW